MDSKNKKTINTIGKIGRVVSTIMLVLTILAAAAVLACMAGAAILPKETIDITLDGDINITSAGTLFAKLDKLLDIKQEGDGAQVNLAGTGDVTVSIAGDDDILEDSNLTKIDNGYVQLCFPVNCTSYSSTGVQPITSKGELSTGEVKSLQTEWLPAEQGECIVIYTATIYSGFTTTGSFSITVNYQYNTTGISNARIANAAAKSAYDIAGRRMSQGKRGLSFVSMADGTLRKVVK